MIYAALAEKERSMISERTRSKIADNRPALISLVMRAMKRLGIADAE
jgi:DNA invertase Pin-like site-specific DNA recombinase